MNKHLLIEIFRALRKSFFHLVFPAKCLHCHLLLPPESPVFCEPCSSQLELIDPNERCPTCFNYLFEPTPLCNHCARYPSLYEKIAAAFDYEGPAATLVKCLKFSNQPYLAKGMAGFLIGQIERLEWPLPDALVPIPISFSRWLERGYNQSALLAEEMSRLLPCPVVHALKRKSGDYSQSALNLKQRKALKSDRFQLDLSNSIEGKVLLVIDDVMTSGLTLQRCSEALVQGKPSTLYALTFCRTLPFI